MQTNEINAIIRDAELEDKYELASIIDADLEKNLVKISEHYCKGKTAYVTKCEASAQQLLMTILNTMVIRLMNLKLFQFLDVHILILLKLLLVKLREIYQQMPLKKLKVYLIMVVLFGMMLTTF